jgi:hypothetical protein
VRTPSPGLPPAPIDRARHRRAKALPFFGRESCEHKPSSCTLPRLSSPCLCPIVVRMLSALCHRHGCAAEILPAHTTTGSRPYFSWPNLCTCTHAHASSFAGVCPPTNTAGPFLAIFPFFVPMPSVCHRFRVAAMAAPSVFGTHTNAGNRGARPLLHLSVTMLDIPSCRHREPLRTGARVSVKPSTPSSNLFGRLDPEHRLA